MWDWVSSCASVEGVLSDCGFACARGLFLARARIVDTVGRRVSVTKDSDKIMGV